MWSLCARFLRGPAACIFVLFSFHALAQGDAKQRAKIVRDLAKGGADAIPQITPYLKDSEIEVRVEAVKALTDIGGPRSLDPLVTALNDNDPEVQIRATDGLVNFYMPGYIKTGLTASIRRAGTAIKGHFTDTNDQVIDPYVQVKAEIITGLGKVARGGANMDARANAARAIGILRGKAAIPDLIDALHSKDSQVIYESLVALEKIRDVTAGPKIAFLVRDLNPKVQMTALEALGLLQDRSAIPAMRDVLDRSRDAKVRRAALTALAYMPENDTRGVFQAYLKDKDDAMRAAAAEGLGRLKNSADQGLLNNAYAGEQKTKAKLADAFALVMMDRLGVSEDSPLNYLVSQFDSRGYRGVSQGYLTELARNAEVRKALYPYVRPDATKDQKIGLAQVLAASGDRESLQYVEKLSKDSDPEVAEEGVRALRILRARVG